MPDVVVRIIGKNVVGGALRSAGRDVSVFGSKSQAAFGGISIKAIAAAGAVAGLAFSLGRTVADAAKTASARFVDYETAMGQVANIMGITRDEARSRLGPEVDRIAKDFSVQGGALEVLNALYQVFSTVTTDSAEALAFTEAAALSALGSNVSLTTAVQAGGKAYVAFAPLGVTAAEVFDLLAKTVDIGATTMLGLANNVGKFTPLLKALNIPLDEGLALFAALTIPLKDDSAAAEILRSSLAKLLVPTEKTSKLFEDLGFTSVDAAIAALGVAGALDVIVQAEKDGKGSFNDFLGDQLAIQGALILTEDGASRVASNIDELGKSFGTAAFQASNMADTIAAERIRIEAETDSLQRNVGEDMANIETGIKAATDAFNTFAFDAVTAGGDIAEQSTALEVLLDVLGGIAQSVGFLLDPNVSIFNDEDTEALRDNPLFQFGAAIGEGLGFSHGGAVPGVGGRDTVAALLTPGEVVLNAAQQRNVAAGLMGGGGDTFNLSGVTIIANDPVELASALRRRGQIQRGS